MKFHFKFLKWIFKRLFMKKAIKREKTVSVRGLLMWCICHGLLVVDFNPTPLISHPVNTGNLFWPISDRINGVPLNMKRMTYSFIDLVVVMTDSMTDDWHFRLERCPRILISWDRYCKQENTRWFNFLQLIAMTVRWWERHPICFQYIFFFLCFFLLLIILTLSTM